MNYDEIADFYRSGLGVKKEASIRLLTENTRFMHRKKGEKLRVAGEPMTTVLFHLNGAGKVYVVNEHGQETVMGFCHVPGEPCLGAAGIQEKIIFNIDAVMDMDVLELKMDALKHVLANDPEVAAIVQKLMAVDHDRDYAWHLAMKTKFGAERYRWFLKDYSDLVGVATQKDIANFLGLKPQSLSRIKAGLEEKNLV